MEIEMFGNGPEIIMAFLEISVSIFFKVRAGLALFTRICLNRLRSYGIIDRIFYWGSS